MRGKASLLASLILLAALIGCERRPQISPVPASSAGLKEAGETSAADESIVLDLMPVLLQRNPNRAHELRIMLNEARDRRLPDLLSRSSDMSACMRAVRQAPKGQDIGILWIEHLSEDNLHRVTCERRVLYCNTVDPLHAQALDVPYAVHCSNAEWAAIAAPVNKLLELGGGFAGPLHAPIDVVVLMYYSGKQWRADSWWSLRYVPLDLERLNRKKASPAVVSFAELLSAIDDTGKTTFARDALMGLRLILEDE